MAETTFIRPCIHGIDNVDSVNIQPSRNTPFSSSMVVILSFIVDYSKFLSDSVS